VLLGQEYARRPENNEINFLKRLRLFIGIYSHFQSFSNLAIFKL
jgi:hypothetical protein